MTSPQSLAGMDAILHDRTEVVSGTVQKLTEYGCELHLNDPKDVSSPTFLRSSTGLLQLINGDESEAYSYPVQIAGVVRAPTGWIYRLSILK